MIVSDIAFIVLPKRSQVWVTFVSPKGILWVRADLGIANDILVRIQLDCGGVFLALLDCSGQL